MADYIFTVFIQYLGFEHEVLKPWKERRPPNVYMDK